MMPYMKQFRFPKGCSVESIVIRETNGDDEAQAIQRAKAKGEAGSVLDELVRSSIAVVDGVEIDSRIPYLAYDSWNSKTRNLVLKAYTKINLTSDQESESFLSQGEDYLGSMQEGSMRAISGMGT